MANAAAPREKPAPPVATPLAHEDLTPMLSRMVLPKLAASMPAVRVLGFRALGLGLVVGVRVGVRG